MESKLKVNPLFYRNFSKFLRKESLKHINGVDTVTRKILDKIKNTTLSKQDVEILFGFNNRQIDEAVIFNASVSLFTKYRSIVQNKKWEKHMIDAFYTFIRRTFTYNKYSHQKIRNYLLKQWDKKIELTKVIDDLDMFEKINDKDETCLPQLPAVKVAMVVGWFTSKTTYGNVVYNVDKITREEVMKYIKEYILPRDIKEGNYAYVNYLFQKVVDKHDSLNQLIPYVIKEVLPKIQYIPEDSGWRNSGDESLTELLQKVKRMEGDVIINKQTVVDIIKSLNFVEDKETTIMYTIKTLV